VFGLVWRWVEFGVGLSLAGKGCSTADSAIVDDRSVGIIELR
jgi:hypothetical protein